MINRHLPVESPMSNQSHLVTWLLKDRSVIYDHQPGCSANPGQKEPGIAVSAYIDLEIPYIRVQSIVESSKYDLGQFYA